MKKLLLFILILATGQILSAQNHYSFSQRSSNYVEMTNGTEISPSDWYDFSASIAFPFSFSFFGDNVDSLHIMDDGISFTGAEFGFLTTHGDDPVGRGAGQSPVTYRVDGTGNARILKVQWPNISFAAIADSFPNDFVNYQVWFYEGTHKIEFHYGSSFITQAALADLELLPGMVSIDGSRFISIGGDPATPVANYDVNTITFLAANPSVNTIYVLTPGFPNGVEETFNGDQVSLYPVPATTKLNVESTLPMEKIYVYNAAGQKLSTHEVAGNKAEIATDLLPAGVYFLQIFTSEGVISKKFSK
ncbi:MAG: T9SS type A sorting domain-containing protein [Bacteroidia bacterium]